MRNVFLALSVVAALLLPLQAQVARAQLPCASTSMPQCDGLCPPGSFCMEDVFGDPANCICQTYPFVCGGQIGAPQCWGDCPPEMPICADLGGICECVIPTLSEWGIIAMSLVMFGGALVLRRRRAQRACAVRVGQQG